MVLLPFVTNSDTTIDNTLRERSIAPRLCPRKIYKWKSADSPTDGYLHIKLYTVLCPQVSFHEGQSFLSNLCQLNYSHFKRYILQS